MQLLLLRQAIRAGYYKAGDWTEASMPMPMRIDKDIITLCLSLGLTPTAAPQSAAELSGSSKALTILLPERYIAEALSAVYPQS